MTKTTWQRGDQRKLAERAGCNYTQLNDIIHGRKYCHPTLAGRLSEAAKELGYNIPRALWVFQDLRKGNTLFPKF